MKKTIENLDNFIQVAIAGIIENPYYSRIGKELKKSYEESFSKQNENKSRRV